MKCPFPGMDPYLEHPVLWPDVHNSIVAAIRDHLAPTLRPRYSVAIEERTYFAEPDELLFVGRADLVVRGDAGNEGGGLPERETRALAVEVPVPDQVRETYLEIRAVGNNQVITALELLSPSNKRPGEGRRHYEEKRRSVLQTRTHLVEVDLLRAGEPMTVLGTDRTADYRILISRGNRRPLADLFLFSVRDPIPAFRLPLLKGDDEPVVDLGRILHDLYDRAAYDLRIDYRTEPGSAVSEADRTWMDAHLRSSGRR